MKQLACFVTYLALFAIILSPNLANGQKIIQLKLAKLAFVPKGFYIDNVEDERQDTTLIAQVTDSSENETFNLKGGASQSVFAYLSNGLTQNETTTPVTLHISELEGTVKKTGDRYDVHIVATFKFYFESKELFNLSETGDIEATTGPDAFMESFIKESLGNTLKQFGIWWDQNKGKVATNPVVKVNVVVGKTMDNPDQIVYNPHIPLTIGDFMGAPDSIGEMLAMTYSGVGFGYATKTENSQTVINLTITPFFDRSKSWFKEKGKLPSVLAHEQLHFDIRALQACDLVKAIKAGKFTRKGYVAEFEQLRVQNANDGLAEQDLYDLETYHGTIKDKQEQWAKKVKQRLKDNSCF